MELHLQGLYAALATKANTISVEPPTGQPKMCRFAYVMYGGRWEGRGRGSNQL